MSTLASELRERFGGEYAEHLLTVDADALAEWLVKRGVGRRGGRRRSRRERPEVPELASAAKRFARALAARAAEGDDLALESLVEVGAAVDVALGEAARAMHGFGYSWTEIGDRLGITRQAARQRFAARLGEEVSS